MPCKIVEPGPILLIDTDSVEDLLEAFEVWGATVLQLSSAAVKSTDRVRAILKKAGANTSSPKNIPFLDVRILNLSNVKGSLSDDALVRMVGEGKTDSEIGSLCGLGRDAIRKKRAKMGIGPVTSNSAVKASYRDKLASVCEKQLLSDYVKLSTKEMSEKYGMVHRVWISYLREELGVLSQKDALRRLL